jgi:hypothetical protein
MNDSLDYRLTKFVQEIEYISRPDNPGKIYYIKDLLNESSIGDLCSILLHFIEDNENDKSLFRLEVDFKTHLITIIECSELDNLPIAIEGLAQKYESFLKKIGYLLYKKTDYWNGNNISSGLSETTLKMLCEGVISNRYGMENYEQLKLDTPLINYKGISRSLIDFLRTELRNAVHCAPNINRKHLIPYSEIVIVIYLLAIQDNIKFLGPRYLSRLALRKKVIKSHDAIERTYVTNIFLENASDKLLAFEPRLTESFDITKEERIEKREGTITEIYSKVNHFIIKGIGGLGKTTTLRFLSNHLLKNGDTTPLFFPLKDYQNGISLINQILLESEITFEDFESDLQSNNLYVFLLDGINEIIDLKVRSELINDLKYLLKKYKRCSTVISSRNIPELLQLDLPVFNIQPLDLSGIYEYVEKNFASLTESLLPRLNNSSRLLRLCSNPLLLQILCTIYENEDLNLINNEALIIRSFVAKSLVRERLKNHKIDLQKLSHYLMDLGYFTRFDASVSFSNFTTFEILSKSSELISPGDDKIEILNSLKDLNFIINSSRGYSFNHELYQEYFAAEGLIYYSTPLSTLQDLDHWRNPILMYSGLIGQREEFINSVAQTDTLLATECALTSIVDEINIEQDITLKSIHSMGDMKNIREYNKGVLSLLKLKRYVELKENLPTMGRDLGYLVKQREELDGLSVVQIIIRELDISELPEFTQILLDKDISYRNDIIRGLLERDKEELKPVLDNICEIVLSTVSSNINSTNLLNLIKLFGYENITIKGIENLDNLILTRLLTITTINSPTFIIAKERHLFSDLFSLCKIIAEADSTMKNVQHFLGIICDYIFTSNSDREIIFASASKSKNLLIYLSGCVYVAKNGYKSAELLFEKYKIFSNKHWSKMLIHSNQNFASLVSTLENEILRLHGPYKDLNALVGKTLSFTMNERSSKDIELSTSINNITLYAIWRGRKAIEFINDGKFQNQSKISLTVTNIDYHKGILLVDFLEPKNKSSEIKYQKRNFSTKETLLGVRLNEALSGEIRKVKK